MTSVGKRKGVYCRREVTVRGCALLLLFVTSYTLDVVTATEH